MNSSIGELKLEWAYEHMDVLRAVRERFRDEKPFDGLKIGMALHVEAKTGILALTLREFVWHPAIPSARMILLWKL